MCTKHCRVSGWINHSSDTCFRQTKRIVTLASVCKIVLQTRKYHHTVLTHCDVDSTYLIEAVYIWAQYIALLHSDDKGSQAKRYADSNRISCAT